jgi:hypothetical protein
MKPKTLGLAAVAVIALTAFAASSASATTLEVGGVKQNSAVAISASLAAGTTTLWTRTDGTLLNTCTTSAKEGKTESGFSTLPTGALSTLTFESCIRTVTVHKPGKLYVEYESGTNGTVFSEETVTTVGTPFGHITCTTGAGTDIGTLTGVSSGHATLHINAVLNCHFLAPSVLWKGTYTITSPTGLGVTA